MDLIDLPIEVYFDIFDYLTCEELKEAMLVSKTWYYIILPYFNKKTALAFHFCKILKDSPPRSILMKSSRPFVHMKIGEKCNLSKCQDDTEFWMHIGHETKTISIDEKNHDDGQELSQILKNFPKLKHLTVKYSRLCQILNFGIPQSIETIHVKKWPVSDNPLHLKKLPHLKRVTAEVLEITTKHVSAPFKLVEYFTGRPKVVISPINLLEIQAIQLTDILDLPSDRPYPLKYSLNTLIKFPSLQRLSLAVHPETLCFFYHETFNLKNVETVDLNYLKGSVHRPYGQIPKACNTCLEYLVKSCPHFHSWRLNCNTLDYEELIKGTPKPLKNIHIRSRANFQKDLNELFQMDVNFSQLVELHLDVFNSPLYYVQIRFLDPTEWPVMPRLKKIVIKYAKFENFSEIFKKCPSVTDAEFSELTTEEFCQIENHWPHLERLVLCFRFYSENVEKINSLQGHFKALRFLESNSINDYVSLPLLTQMKLFEKIPTLRKFLSIGYNKIK